MSTSLESASIRLTNAERNALNIQLERDGYVILPQKLPDDLIADVLDAIDRISAQIRAADPATSSIKQQNCVDLDLAFLRLVMYEPALQLTYDAFGPMFHLNQSNFVSRVKEAEDLSNFVTSSPWHADGPRPNLFPAVNGAMGLHYLKFGYFLTDLTHGTGGSLQIVRGSHTHLELDGKGKDFNIEDYADDFVQIDCEAGTVVAFHQAQWHAAPPNLSDIERKNVYVSYCPTWMRPVDREFPTEEQIAGLTPEERWILGEPRRAQRWWIPNKDDLNRMSRFKRDV
jgi:ectoine hydroxylase-related dioxygenase (phytanoyl-CoA dioxygenase family)